MCQIGKHLGSISRTNAGLTATVTMATEGWTDLQAGWWDRWGVLGEGGSECATVTEKQKGDKCVSSDAEQEAQTRFMF